MCHGESGSAGAEAHSRRYSRFRDVRLSCSSLCQIWFGKECFQCCELPDENLPFGDKPSFRHALFPDGNDSPFRKTGQKYSLLLMLLQKIRSFSSSGIKNCFRPYAFYCSTDISEAQSQMGRVCKRKKHGNRF